jgi:hypothetical protein
MVIRRALIPYERPASRRRSPNSRLSFMPSPADDGIAAPVVTDGAMNGAIFPA